MSKDVLNRTKSIDNQSGEHALSGEILELSEELARHVHEVWMAGRIADGWRWGSERNDAERLHPCIVEYERLSEEEKDYDRRTSQQTLKFILERGFEIKKVKG
ncbi:MAG: RyR domain-containing protein [Rikenellaceae bacterium]